MSASAIRSKPDHYLLSRSLSPEFVTRDDIIEFKLDGTPIERHPPGLSRALHPRRDLRGAAGVNAVIHSHAEDILPFSISKTPMCCVAHVASDMGTHVPVWDIADKFGDETNLLVINMEQGRDMARVLGKNSVVLMRGHGFSAAADGLLKLVRMCGLPAAQRPHPACRDADGRVQGACPRARSRPATSSAPARRKCSAAGSSGRAAPAAATCSPSSKGGV